MKFAKAHALGNDFLFIEASELVETVDRSRLARAVCDRLRGIGADGLIVFDSPSESSGYAMKLYNSDGSPAELSGNGLRCLGAYLTHAGRVSADRFVVDTDAGPRGLERVSGSGPRYVFRADMGAPRLGSADVPFELDPPAEPVVSVPLEVDGRTFRVTALWMCNPQCVILTERLDFEELRRYGPKIESHARFPRKTNVEFCEVRDRGEIAIGIWERGAGETAASGTGSAASAVAAILNGKADERVTVRCPGGILEVEWVHRDRVFVTGEAVVVAEGRYFGVET